MSINRIIYAKEAVPVDEANFFQSWSERILRSVVPEIRDIVRFEIDTFDYKDTSSDEGYSSEVTFILYCNAEPVHLDLLARDLSESPMFAHLVTRQDMGTLYFLGKSDMLNHGSHPNNLKVHPALLNFLRRRGYDYVMADEDSGEPPHVTPIELPASDLDEG